MCSRLKALNVGRDCGVHDGVGVKEEKTTNMSHGGLDFAGAFDTT